MEPEPKKPLFGAGLGGAKQAGRQESLEGPEGHRSSAFSRHHALPTTQRFPRRTEGPLQTRKEVLETQNGVFRIQEAGRIGRESGFEIESENLRSEAGIPREIVKVATCLGDEERKVCKGPLEARPVGSPCGAETRKRATLGGAESPSRRRLPS